MRAGSWSHGAVLGLALLSAAVLPARAAEDGGTRSLFATPTGSRGLALGGAFVAVPGDPTGAAWNPSGLGWVSRYEAHVSTVSYDLDFREDFVSIVVPSWRMGTAGITIRRFGTNGIDGRDDRNVSTGDDLSSSETEVTLAYGRTLNPVIGVGGSLKIQRQSIVGQSGSGIGADLGVTAYPLVALHAPVRWAPQVTWGLSLRNLIEPSIRLDQESVRDPATWRTGFAYRTLYGVATLDIETSRGPRPRIHAGTEFSPRPFMALRGGLNSDGFTAGAGFRARGVSLDYSFEDRTYDAIHRVGVSYAFGRTVTERREAAQREEEEKLQTRLAETYQRVQRERIQTLLARAEEARAESSYAEAFEALATITTLEPNHPEALDLEIRCLREHGAKLEAEGELAEAAVTYGRILERRPEDPDARVAQGRCRAESDRRAARSADIRKAFARAMDAFAADDLVGARSGFATILRETPNDDDARAMLRRTQAALSRRTQSLLRDARRSLTARQLDQATNFLERARALDPNAEGVAALAAAIERARPSSGRNGDVSKASAGPPTPSTASGLSDRELRELYRRGLEALSEKRSADALRYFELVWSSNPRYQRVAEYLKREYLLLGLDAYAAGRLDDAVAQWERALQVDPGDARARGYLTRARQQLERSREVVGESR